MALPASGIQHFTAKWRNDVWRIGVVVGTRCSASSTSKEEGVSVLAKVNGQELRKKVVQDQALLRQWLATARAGDELILQTSKGEERTRRRKLHEFCEALMKEDQSLMLKPSIRDETGTDPKLYVLRSDIADADEINDPVPSLTSRKGEKAKKKNPKRRDSPHRPTQKKKKKNVKSASERTESSLPTKRKSRRKKSKKSQGSAGYNEGEKNSWNHEKVSEEDADLVVSILEEGPSRALAPVVFNNVMTDEDDLSSEEESDDDDDDDSDRTRLEESVFDVPLEALLEESEDYQYDSDEDLDDEETNDLSSHDQLIHRSMVASLYMKPPSPPQQVLNALKEDPFYFHGREHLATVWTSSRKKTKSIHDYLAITKF